tara:strand:+ start:126 stop:269 length:144 start_codon:yes stop_codon:yes gene_type:complete
MNDVLKTGAIAQLVEHLHGMQGVRGSNPLGSINYFDLFKILIYKNTL